jgi:hypothetical protein
MRRFIQRRGLIAAAASGVLSACSHALGLQPTYGIVVDYELLPGASKKEGVAAISDTGRLLFSPADLLVRTAIKKGSGGRNSYGGGALPAWVRVTWREGDWDFDRSGASRWKGGTIVGDHRIEVASRIPKEVLAYTRAVRGRAIRLIFWVKDDGVLLAWDVQEPPDGTVWRYSLHGGDFEEPTVYNGKLVKPGWYLTPDGRKIMIDR